MATGRLQVVSAFTAGAGLSSVVVGLAVVAGRWPAWSAGRAVRRRVAVAGICTGFRLPRTAGGGRAGWDRRRAPVPGWFRRRWARLGVSVAADRAWRVGMTAYLGVVAVGLVVGGPVAGVVAGLALAGGAVAAADAIGDRTARQIDAALPDLVDDLVVALRSGSGLTPALVEAARAAGPLQRDLLAISGALDTGLPLTDALAGWARHRPTPGVRAVSVALTLSAEIGGHTRPLEGVASSLRDRTAVDHELRAASAQARASAGLLVAVPFVFLALSALHDPSALRFFVDEPVGAGCLVVGLALDLAGAWWMGRALRSAG